ncbi:MAG TPA: hypothetical protein VG096_17870 [Bryobacteraceae bacterium]|nr:hypothetical protein [Bryobacteraceae bacterium]
MTVTQALTVALLAAQGFFLLRPNGAMVHFVQPAAQRRSEQSAYWFRKSPVHMGCSIASCNRPATRTASYRQLTARGTVWRAYGFCEKHEPPDDGTGLVYRLGRPETFGYDVPLAPQWAPIYFLLGIFGYGVWCAGMWRYASSTRNPHIRAFFLVLHAGVLAVLWSV